ncbi:hypothetical protein ACU8OQ_37080 (plasmid) [Rhizobium leguminosarum]|jgi:hypothetical protein
MISDARQRIDAKFEIDGDGRDFSLIFKADGGSGKNRLNRDYGVGFETLMRRLSSIAVSLEGAYLDSRPAQKLELEKRRLGPVKKTFLPAADIRTLCSSIRRDAAAFDVPDERRSRRASVKAGGNQTRRLLLKISAPVAYDVSVLREYLENGSGAEIERMRMAPGETATAFGKWLEMLRTGERVGKDTWYFLSHNIRVKIGPRLINGVPIARFAEGRRGTDWIVEINPPRIPDREDGLSMIAIDSLNRRWLLRQGILHQNQLSKRVERDRFSELTGLKSVHLEGATRPWYPVELLDSSAPSSLATLEFVARCALARGDDRFSFPANEVELLGAPEIAHSYTLPASTTPEREVRRRQGEVWEALERLVRQNGGELKKPRHAKGYEVDGLLRIRAKSILIEIKTTTSAADIYTGVGQLLLYRKIIPHLADTEMVLLLPASVAKHFVEAVSAYGIRILMYRLDPDKPSQLEWPASTLEHLGVG